MLLPKQGSSDSSHMKLATLLKTFLSRVTNYCFNKQIPNNDILFQ